MNKVEYRLKPGQNAFFMHNNEVAEGEVKKINVIVTKHDTVITVELERDQTPYNRFESKVFATKAELLASL